MSETTNKWIGRRTIRPDGADKVTGRAAFAADTAMAGMIWGKVLRSPHPHAHIRGIDTSKAEALPGVKAVVTSADITEMQSEWVPAGELQINFRDLAHNILANGKVFYDGHAAAAEKISSTVVRGRPVQLATIGIEGCLKVRASTILASPSLAGSMSRE